MNKENNRGAAGLVSTPLSPNRFYSKSAKIKVIIKEEVIIRVTVYSIKKYHIDA